MPRRMLTRRSCIVWLMPMAVMPERWMVHGCWFAFVTVIALVGCTMPERDADGDPAESEGDEPGCIGRGCAYGGSFEDAPRRIWMLGARHR